MSFYNIIEKYSQFNFKEYFNKISENDVIKSLNKESLNRFDFLNLLSPTAQKFLEPMAQKARQLTIQYFGRTISLYIPLYISNYCSSNCTYCGFSKKNNILRKKLNYDEIEKELYEISQFGIRHILLLTGESPKITPIDYIMTTVNLAKKYFDSVSLEIYPMKQEEYAALVKNGVDGLTIYQEVYDEKIYNEVHLAGEKKDYHFRLETPERAANAGMPFVNIGALLGLGEKRSEVFLSGLHAEYLQNKYLETFISISLPRINHAEGGYIPKYPVDDITFVQFMLAYRLFLPRLGINISTRERAEFRDHLLMIGATKFSAGSITEVGGYTNKGKGTPQFEISDNRTTQEIKLMLKNKKYQPIYKDWEIV